MKKTVSLIAAAAAMLPALGSGNAAAEESKPLFLPPAVPHPAFPQ